MLNRRKNAEDEKEKRAIVAEILKNAYRIRVLRAMCAHGGIPSFEGSGLQDDTCSHTRVDGWLQMRVSVMQDAYRKICANPEVSLSFIEREISSDRIYYLVPIGSQWEVPPRAALSLLQCILLFQTMPTRSLAVAQEEMPGGHGRNSLFDLQRG